MVTVTVVYQQDRFPWLFYGIAYVQGSGKSVTGPRRFTQAAATRAAERALLRTMRGA